MNLEQLNRAVPLLIKANIVPLIIGHKGTAKTERMKQIGKELGFTRVYNMRLGQLADSGDITGLPNFVTIDGQEMTSFRAPDYMPKPGEKVLIVMDEINRVQNRQILNAIFQMIERERRIGNYQLPDDTRIVALANPPTDEYAGTMDFRDEAFKSRFCHIFYSPSNADFLTYVNTSGKFHSEVSGFLNDPESNDFIHSKKSVFTIDYMNPDWRAWQYVSDFLGQNPDEDLLLEVIQGMVGVEASARFYEHRKNVQHQKPIPLSDVLGNALGLSEKVKKYTAHPELLDITFQQLQAEVKTRSENKQDFSETEVIGMSELLINANKELTLRFMQDVISESSIILSVDSWNKYIARNHEITCLVMLAAGIINEGEEHLLIGIHDRVVEEIEDETTKAAGE